jgi:hypothetical protein
MGLMVVRRFGCDNGCLVIRLIIYEKLYLYEKMDYYGKMQYSSGEIAVFLL